MQQMLGGIAVGLGLFGYVFYIRGIWQGKVKPHAFTWFIWTILTTIAWIAQIVEHGGAGAWVTGVTALFSFIFTLVGLRKSSRAFITKSDWIFFIGALLTIPLWYFTGNALLSVIIVTIIDAAAFAPTIRKAFFKPETENKWTYLLSGFKFFISLFALQSFTWTTALYPAFLVFANCGFVFLLVWRKKDSIY